ncbi:MAG: methylated-DNA--[protein]-cysteine S-methyltransferase [Wenzhouxiangellaceae bacterium]|nr:methylated-DNA--[protein]-cysteine S-methyltransferase [Wenzhouxiangellaceae bacterium]
MNRNASPESLTVASMPCALGHVLLAASGRGVAWLSFGDEPDTMRAQLARVFARTEILSMDNQQAATEIAATASAAVAALINRGTPLPSLALDPHGTPFQHAVWHALQQIPAGQTRSYSYVAQSIGKPGAARAVASACANNRIALLIPCHRVIAADGRLSGYRWGVKRKAELLARERSARDD